MSFRLSYRLFLGTMRTKGCAVALCYCPLEFLNLEVADDLRSRIIISKTAKVQYGRLNKIMLILNCFIPFIICSKD